MANKEISNNNPEKELITDKSISDDKTKQINKKNTTQNKKIVPKNDKTENFILDFRELNKQIKQHPYPIPKIQDLFLKLKGFQYTTLLDLNMGYYHIE